MPACLPAAEPRVDDQQAGALICDGKCYVHPQGVARDQCRHYRPVIPLVFFEYGVPLRFNGRDFDLIQCIDNEHVYRFVGIDRNADRILGVEVRVSVVCKVILLERCQVPGLQVQPFIEDDSS